MYWWLFVVVGIVWLWLAGGTVSAWRRKRLGGFWTLMTVGGWTGIAALVILFAAPYWKVIYDVAVQPG